MRRAVAPLMTMATLLVATTACGTDESPKASTNTEATSEQEPAPSGSEDATPTGALSGADAIDAAMDAGIFATRPDEAMIQTATVSESGATATAATASFDEFYAAIGYVDGTDFMAGSQHPNGRCGATSGVELSEGVSTIIIQCKPSAGTSTTAAPTAKPSGSAAASWPADVPLPAGATVTSGAGADFEISYSGAGVYEAFKAWGSGFGSVTREGGDDEGGRILVETTNDAVTGLRPSGASGPATVDIMISGPSAVAVFVY